MARSIVLTISDEDDAILTKLVEEFNKNQIDSNQQLTADQFIRFRALGWIRSHSARLFQEENASISAALTKATPAEQTTIRTILSKYR